MKLFENALEKHYVLLICEPKYAAHLIEACSANITLSSTPFTV